MESPLPIPLAFIAGTGRAFQPGAAPSNGFRLHIPDVTAVRFEPGERKRIPLVALACERIVYGGNGLTDGQLDEAGKKQVLERLSKYL